MFRMSCDAHHFLGEWPELSVHACRREVGTGRRSTRETPVIALTPRQATIRDMLVEGMTAKEIGARLGISHRTVQECSETVRKKYGAQNRFQLIRLVLQGEPAK